MQLAQSEHYLYLYDLRSDHLVRVDLQSSLTFRFCLLYFSLIKGMHNGARKLGLHIEFKLFLPLGKQIKELALNIHCYHVLPLGIRRKKNWSWSPPPY